MYDGASVRWFVLAMVSVWFTLVVPAHERGAIRVDGGAAGSCCAVADAGPADVPPGCCALPAESDRPDAPTDPVRCCAICKVVAKMGGPEAALVWAPLVLPRYEAPAERYAGRPVSVVLDADRTRGPPALI